MNKQEKIDIIYEKMANKEWNNGCKFKMKEDKFNNVYIIINSQPSGSSSDYIEDGMVKSPKYCLSDIGSPKFGYFKFGRYYTVDFSKTKELLFYRQVETIGHPVMIGDVLAYLIEHDICTDDCGLCDMWREGRCVLEKWKNKRTPIEEQSKECIDYMFDLIK